MEQSTFLLAIATFALALVAAVSAGFTAWMACETRKSRKLYEEMVEEDRKKRGTITLIGKGGKILA